LSESDHTTVEALLARILAEVLQLQRWAGGPEVPRDRIHGLLEGLQSTLEQEVESFGITRDEQDAVEDVLDDIERGKQNPSGLAIKHRMIADDIDEMDFHTVVEQCILESRFTEGISKLDGYSNQKRPIVESREREWIGALHYMEICDCTEGVETKLHSVFAAEVPRIDEIISPEGGSDMRVIDVVHRMVRMGDEGETRLVLIPHVLVEPLDSDDDEFVDTPDPSIPESLDD
jgi:hypothetical protein